ncbi:hypothetical protein DFP72DRAFT_927527 [Ephemerocybe angulata]|uniref:BHLH domain-containing protein n=1 Tax=Ephemerocybe angulata TaxID=980116 RepID=A0A8H6LY46_9AGAR|nr:hypothetical protein DFP72DRAFT_927527 [Tulosesus angulatus]
MSNDLGLDPSDPLNLILRNPSDLMEDNSSTDDSSSPADWTQLSTLWDGGADMKSYTDLMDFNDLGMDFDPSMGLDPSAMHYGYPAYDATFQSMPQEMQFPFTFQNALDNASVFSSGASSSGSSTKERRLSVGSSASSSANSLSPGPSDAGYSQPTTPKVEVKKQSESPRPFDPALELAERVRQTAGVMLAVPMSASGYATQSTAAPAPSKLPIPRLPRQAISPKSPISSSSSAASTPPPATPPMSSAVPSVSAPAARPKTSHTTIERRYRTNLNARIQSLRMAVPALRVLEDRDGGNGKKIKKNLKDGVYLKGAGIGIDGENGTVDVIDERGFVDGVKVARKCSKANVLGKAVEYIRVLKKRENRLKAEQNGLKALVCGLVGGPALLKEWEQRWRERFGGEERDEVEGEEAEEFDSDDEEGDDGEEETGKKRKRAKVANPPLKKEKAAAPPPSVANVISQLGGSAPGMPGVPEKRKRGRPRKVPIAPTPVATLAPQASQSSQDAPMQQQQQDQIMLGPPIELQHQQQHHGQQPQQYLLAVFALFSFFNSPLTSSFSSASSSHHHTGVLLNPPLALAPEIISQFTPPVEPAHRLMAFGSWSWGEYVQGFHLAVSVLVLGSFLCNYMGISLTLGKKNVKNGEEELKKGADGQIDWAAVCDEKVLNADSKPLSLLSNVQMFASLFTAKSPSVARLTSSALAITNQGGLLNPLAWVKARSLWARAQAAPAKLSEKLVLQTWGVEEASRQLSSVSKEAVGSKTPIEVLAASLVRQRVKKHLGWLFVDAVGSSSEDCGDKEREKEREKERVGVQREMRRTVEAAMELGGSVAELGRVFEGVWKWKAPSSSSSSSESDSDLLEISEDDEDEEIRALLTGLVLYRRVFASCDEKSRARVSVVSALISPPPSPSSSRPHSRVSGRKAGGVGELRRVLGSRVFEDAAAGLEDARDTVVDLVVEMERVGRGVSP